MGLFRDAVNKSLETLAEYDSSVFTVAYVEKIDLREKLKIAHREVKLSLIGFLQKNASIYDLQDAESLVDRVVLTEGLEHWLNYQALAVTYRDAFGQQLNDRYRAKWTEYERLAREAREQVFRTGVGLVHEPLPQMSRPSLELIPGPHSYGAYWVRVAAVRRSTEGEASPAASIEAQPNTTLRVRISKLPAGADGWNVYVGSSPDGLSRQNPAPVTSLEWTLPDVGILPGPGPSAGQLPDYYVRLRRILHRG